MARTELSPLNFLQYAAGAMAGRTAVVHGSRRYTYGELAGRAGRLAAAVRAAGVEPQDRVAVLLPNSPAMLEAHFGVPAAGGVLVTINSRLSAAEVGYILRDSTPRLLIVDAELEKLVDPSDVDGIRVVVSTDTGTPDDPYEQFLATAPAEPVRWGGTEDDPISINYTSGTTGRPKGAVYTHRGAYLRALGVALQTAMDAGTVFLWTLPMFHCNGWCMPWGVTAVGGRHVCLRKVEPGPIWDMIDAEGVTHYSGAPTVHLMLVDHEGAHRPDRPVTVPTGGSPPSPTLLARMHELDLHPIHLYGLTETYGPVLSGTPHPEWSGLPSDQQARLLSRQGQAYNGSDVARVVDADMADVPADGVTLGEIVLSGNSVMLGYWNKPDETAEAFAGGWFHSGDIGVVHPDGYIELRDRKKDVIISGGENISSVEVEQVLATHPDVFEAAVVATPDEKWGERPKAYVELKPGSTLSAGDLLAYVKEHLARYKAPAGIEFGPLPRTSTGKVQKNLLREREWAGREKAIQ